MENLLIKPNNNTNIPIDVTPETAGWKYIGFRIERLKGGGAAQGRDDTNELCLVVVQGQGELFINEVSRGNFGDRMSPFDGLPHAIYLPKGTKWRVEATTELELAICSAPSIAGNKALRQFRPEDLITETRGCGANTRYVTNILAEGDDAADTLFVIELITPGGHTSSYPPHKHDIDDFPTETQLEETYYSRFNPPQGFAFQRVYTDDRSLDQALVLEEGTLTLVPRGYHPVAVCHGYDLYQLCVMAGPKRNWRFHNEAAHQWLLAK
ncbi:5-deoxy-glucuronate isomerase [Brucella pseudogrignonensis]|uniref:KduI/IolB family protein n=1 Tax=Brucella pseudogrignonensis TaxID=419475 RepID=A0A256GV10_9HYPH|nr:5-deoxy-glucuronate isomerase [Brucella pseudogrignonensis]OYR30969.1 kduI/IolB family protein [Brucella pseudogrignonensis]